jgi:hypothetical protein
MPKCKIKHIVLIHSLHDCKLSMKGLEDTLQKHRCYPVGYDVNKKFEVMLDQVHRSMMKLFDDDQKKHISVIGHSFGGLIANRLHTKGWVNIDMGIYILSPLNGLTAIPANDFYIVNTFDIIKPSNKEEVPPHPYKTLSFSWPFVLHDIMITSKNSMFDKKHHVELKSPSLGNGFLNADIYMFVNSILY